MCLHGTEAALELEGARPLCRNHGLSQRWSCQLQIFLAALLLAVTMHTKEAAGK